MRRTSLAVLLLAACSSTKTAPPAPPPSDVVWQDVVDAAGPARNPSPCSAAGYQIETTLPVLREHEARMASSPQNSEPARDAHLVGRRLQREGTGLLDYMVGRQLVREANAHLTALGQPLPAEQEPPALSALAAHLMCSVAMIENMRHDPRYAGGLPSYYDAEIAATRLEALTYFSDARAAGGDQAALERLIAPAEARLDAAESTTPAMTMVLGGVARHYVGLVEGPSS